MFRTTWKEPTNGNGCRFPRDTVELGAKFSDSGAAMGVSLNTEVLCFFLSTMFLFATGGGWARDISAIVTTDWLARNLSNPKVVILDIRSVAQYNKGHIPGSVHTPFSMWAVSANSLSLEMPSDEALRDLLGKSGIDPNSLVVVVTRTDTDFARADATRVAWTCVVAGIKNVAVLDGGYTKWVKDGKAVSTDAPEIKSTAYMGTIDRSTVASKAYVLNKIGKSIFLDTRKPEDYFGKTSKPGHIKSAVNLPTPWIFTDDGTYMKEEDLRAMAVGVLGAKKPKEIIVYCGVGGFASTWWFVLTQMLGYQNVKVYDGSMEEWIKDPRAPVNTYSWR